MNHYLMVSAFVSALAVTGVGLSADEPMWAGGEGKLEVTSTTFRANGALPDSMIYNFNYPNPTSPNICTADGSAGGDESPQLQWAHVPKHTRSFVVVMYDTTASFTHWGMYNISKDLRALPEGAGVAGSSYGTQITNDFPDPNYDGPCPPQGVAPDAHHYVFTVYALDKELKLAGSVNFPANASTLYQALIDAARDGHILASGSIASDYSATPP